MKATRSKKMERPGKKIGILRWARRAPKITFKKSGSGVQEWLVL